MPPVLIGLSIVCQKMHINLSCFLILWEREKTINKGSAKRGVWNWKWLVNWTMFCEITNYKDDEENNSCFKS